MTAALTVVAGGPLTTVQDTGRTGYAHLGVPGCGPADWVSHELANRLVGNPAGAAALEFTLSGPTLRAGTGCTVAVVGAAPVQVAGRPQPAGRTLRLSPGDVLTVGTLRRGVRGYVAVAGGVRTGLTLGSRCTDLLSGLGPPPLRPGALVPVDEDVPAPPERMAADPPPPQDAVRAVAGPRADWFAPESTELFYRATWTVTPASDRVGMRLSGPLLHRAVADELDSEGVLTGAVQVTGDGRPLVLLAGHGTTGGYPVIATVVWADLPALAQRRPGQPLRFIRCDVAAALRADRDRRQWVRDAVGPVDPAAGRGI